MTLLHWLTYQCHTTDSSVSHHRQQCVTHHRQQCVTPQTAVCHTTDSSVSHTTDSSVSHTTDSSVSHHRQQCQTACKQQLLLTVASSFCVKPLACRPCWMSRDKSRPTVSWCNSSVSRSSLATFLAAVCCLFCPAATNTHTHTHARTCTTSTPASQWSRQTHRWHTQLWYM